MNVLEPGSLLGGFVIDACVHSGGMAHIYRVRYADGRSDPGFPMAMKVPRMTSDDSAENIVSFEVEHLLMQVLTGPHVPRLVAAGDLQDVPYLVMEYVQGQTLEHWLPGSGAAEVVPSHDTLASLGAATARAVHSLHQQNACHLDLKPANVVIKPDGTAVLLDFGLSCHAHYPDLLAEELRKAVGSPVWISPEQVVGVRGDPRSDVFAIGVMLYELATGELPFGSPTTDGGLRLRLWMDPKPPRALRPDLPEWLQEVILCCLEHEAAHRYPSAAHLAFDLTHPDQVRITARGRRTRGTGFWRHLKRWLKAAGKQYQPSPMPSRQIDKVPIVMVALPHHDPNDGTLYALRQAVERSLGLHPGARLACVTVISPSEANPTEGDDGETQVHLRHLAMMRQWSKGLDINGQQTSYHVLESGDAAQALVRYAHGNHVSMIVIGAATYDPQMQRPLSTIPIKVVMEAPCTVIVVKQQLPFDRLAP